MAKKNDNSEAKDVRHGYLFLLVIATKSVVEMRLIATLNSFVEYAGGESMQSRGNAMYHSGLLHR